MFSKISKIIWYNKETTKTNLRLFVAFAHHLRFVLTIQRQICLKKCNLEDYIHFVSCPFGFQY